MLFYEQKLARKGYARIAGVDEAGRGSLAGPVVAAAVILKSRDFENRIDDSKKLTRLQRENTYREITDKAHIGTGIVDEKTIDAINILEATRLSMQEALKRLPLQPDLVLLDGNINLPIDVPYESIIGGDGLSLSIACASIIAKVTRDRIMSLYHSRFPEYNFLAHKGYGTREHLAVLQRIGPSAIHRLSFAPLNTKNPAG
jgi:ribonuclease HII